MIRNATWLGLIEVRKQGSLGIFTWTPFHVYADTYEKAVEWLFDDIHHNGLEARFGALTKVQL